MSRTAIVHATALLPSPDRFGQVDVLPDATVLIESGRISRIESGLPPPADFECVDAEARLLTPGLVDCHTHAVFLGDRAEEFALRASGASYVELAKRGGGIAATVTPTRAGPSALRLETARTRLKRLAAQGITSVEVKTGYGLSIDHERELLEELSDLSGASGSTGESRRWDADDATLPRVFPTLLAAHAVPPEAKTPQQRAAYVDAIATDLIPDAARRDLTRRVDVFVDDAGFTADEARIIAAAARSHGLALHLHVDQTSDGGGAALAAELGAQAAAHLEYTGETGIRALAGAGTIAVMLPTATLAARVNRFAPARELVTAGVRLALSTNLNPGTGPTESISLAFFLAAVSLGLSPEEILWAATRGGALALGEPELGLMREGGPADLVLWNATSLAHLPYHAAVNHAALVLKAGQPIADRRLFVECTGTL